MAKGIFALALLAGIATPSFAASIVTGYCNISPSRTSAEIFATNNSSNTVVIDGYVDVTYYNANGFPIDSEHRNVNESLSSHSTESIFTDSSLSGSPRSCNVDFSNALKPAAPTNVVLLNATKTSLSLDWSLGTGGGDQFSYYVVAYSRNYTDPSCTTSPRESTYSSSITLTNLTEASFYYVKVCSVGKSGGIAAAPVVRFATIADPSPEVVQLEAKSPGIDVISAKWQSGGGTTYDYVTRIGLASNPPQNCVNGNVVTTNSVVYTVLQPNTDYVIRVCSRNLNGLMTAGVTTQMRTQDPSHVSLPFIDLFAQGNNTSLSAAWTVVSGGFVVKGQEANTTVDQTSVALANVGNVSDVSVSVDLDLKEGDVENAAGAVVRYVKSGSLQSMIVGRIRAKRIGGRKFLGEIVLVKNNQETVLSSVKVKRQNATLELRVIGNQATLVFDHETLDTVPVNGAPASGAIGITGMGLQEILDNFSSKSI